MTRSPHALQQTPDATPSLQAVVDVGEWVTDLLPPPYERLVHWDLRAASRDPPLGSIACTCPGDGLSAAAGLLGTVCRWPWVMPCLQLRREQHPCEAVLDLFPGLRCYAAVREDRTGTGCCTPSALVTAVQRRPLPMPSVLAQWVCFRIGRPDLRPFLLAQFREALEGVPASGFASAATYSRHFADEGPFTARDWRAVARLSVKLCNGTANGDSAHCLGRRSALHVRKYLGVSARTAASLLGWEWVLEQALRVGGYVGGQRRSMRVTFYGEQYTHALDRPSPPR